MSQFKRLIGLEFGGKSYNPANMTELASKTIIDKLSRISRLQHAKYQQMKSDFDTASNKNISLKETLVKLFLLHKTEVVVNQAIRHELELRDRERILLERTAPLEMAEKQHPLFDKEYYRKSYRDLWSYKGDLFQHYLQYGYVEQRKPHPLFEPGYYLRSLPSHLMVHPNPLIDFLHIGAKYHRNPHPLFSISYYLNKYKDVGELNINPMIHFLLFGWKENRDPHPLFSTSFYRSQYVVAGDEEINPLIDFLEFGLAKKRRPNAIFDPNYYFEANSDVIKIGLNPLIHYELYGRNESRKFSKIIDVELFLKDNFAIPTPYPDALELFLMLGEESTYLPKDPRLEPKEYPEGNTISVSKILDHQSIENALPGNNQVLFLISHVSPYPSAAGNEYRIGRMMEFFKEKNFHVILILCPFPDKEITNAQIQECSKVAHDVIVCNRSGELVCAVRSPEAKQALFLINNSTVPQIDLIPVGITPERQAAVRSIEKVFCPNPLIITIQTLAEQFKKYALVTNYVFNTRFLNLLPSEKITCVDTHDVHSTKKNKVSYFGVPEPFILELEEEMTLLNRADIALAIQEDEANILKPLCRKVIQVGIDCDIQSYTKSTEKLVLFVSSINEANIKGINDFLRFSWPVILKSSPQAKLLIVGKIGEAIGEVLQDNVEVLGRVDSLEPYYKRASVVINPAVAGTGLKVKTLEALCYFKQIVCWSSGVEGMPNTVAQLCRVATNWYEFTKNVITLLNDNLSYTELQRDEIAAAFSKEQNYALLLSEFKAFFNSN